MPSKFKEIIKIVFGILILLLCGYGIFIAVRAALNIFSSMKSDIAVAIIAAAATIFVSVVSILIGKAYESRNIIKKELRDKKIPVYEGLLKFLFDSMNSEKLGKIPNDSEAIRYMSELTQRAMVWCSDDVLKAWVVWRKQLLTDNKEEEWLIKSMVLFGSLILTIRTDLGHSNKGLQQSDILSLFINDLEKHFPQSKTNEKANSKSTLI